MKTSNRRYAKRQSQWIRNKLLPAVQASKAAEGGKSVEVYLLDATGLHYPSYPKLEDQRLIVDRRVYFYRIRRMEFGGAGLSR